MTMLAICQSRVTCPEVIILLVTIKMKTLSLLQDLHLVGEVALHINKDLRIILGLTMAPLNNPLQVIQTFLKKLMVRLRVISHHKKERWNLWLIFLMFCSILFIDAALIESNVTSVEKLQVSLVCDAPGAQMRRSVEGLGGNLRISVSKDEESSDGKCN